MQSGGGAGKGSILAHSLVKFSQDLLVIDMDKNRHNLFMAGSGVQICEPESVLTNFGSNLTILVANPSHLSEVKEYAGNQITVKTPNMFMN